MNVRILVVDNAADLFRQRFRRETGKSLRDHYCSPHPPDRASRPEQRSPLRHQYAFRTPAGHSSIAPIPAIASAYNRQEGSTDSGHHCRTTAAATTIAGMRQEMAMRSETTDGRSASQCQA
jgi:hypothetical protein